MRFHLTTNVAAPAVVLFQSFSIASSKMSASGTPTIGVLATKGIPLRIAADREKGRASWRQAGFPAQSLLRHRFRRALRAFICTFCVRVFIYVYVWMCADMIYAYICMCVCICTSMRSYTCVCVCVCIFVHRLWVLV